MESISENKLVGIIGLSREIGLPVRWIKKQTDAGNIPCLRVGRRFLFSLDAVKKALLILAEQAGEK